MALLAGFGRRLLLDSSVFRQELIPVRFKRRRVNPPPWIPIKFHPVRDLLYKEDRKLVENLLSRDEGWLASRLPTKSKSKSSLSKDGLTLNLIPGVPNVPDCSQNEYDFETTKRIGMVGRKIGMTLQWMRDGTRCLCTLIHCPDNVVLSANDPETWYRLSIRGKLKVHRMGQPFWSQMVGALNHESVFYTDEYRAMFERAGCPTKDLMGGFLVSEDAIVKPGTKLDVRHFKPGQYVNISGKTIDWGFQGVMHRWGMRGQQNKRTTKAHRRVGSIGVKSEAKVWPGRCLPGHMGFEWRRTVGVEIVRINPIKQVIYVRGSCSGDIGEMLLINDCQQPKKRVRDPPFPTFCPPADDFTQQLDGEGGQELGRIHNITSKDIYHPMLHQFSQPSVVYTEADETKSKIRDKSRAKTAKIKK